MRQRFIQSFSTSGTEQEALNANELGKPYVCFIEDGQYIDWNTLSPFIPFSAQPLTFEILSAGTIMWKTRTPSAATVTYSINGGEWISIVATTDGTPIPVYEGDKVQFKGYDETWKSNSGSFSGSSAYFNVYGNIMSLIDGNNFTGLTNSLTTSILFMGSNVVDASNLILPSTELYGSNMFQDCTSLTAAPELPGTTLTINAYASMFRNCTSLVTGPSVLPATTLVQSCYANMFSGCTSLTTAPVLPATTLVSACYGYMFSGCTSLNYIKCLATEFGYSTYTSSWTSGVAATGTFVKKAGASWHSGVNGIPNGWTVIEE